MNMCHNNIAMLPVDKVNDNNPARTVSTYPPHVLLKAA